MRLGAVIAGIVFAVCVLILVSAEEDRLPCNAEGDVRYIGERQYKCKRTAFNGLRWTWQFQF